MQEIYVDIKISQKINGTFSQYLKNIVERNYLNLHSTF